MNSASTTPGTSGTGLQNVMPPTESPRPQHLSSKASAVENRKLPGSRGPGSTLTSTPSGSARSASGEMCASPTGSVSRSSASKPSNALGPMSTSRGLSERSRVVAGNSDAAGTCGRHAPEPAHVQAIPMDESSRGAALPTLKAAASPRPVRESSASALTSPRPVSARAGAVARFRPLQSAVEPEHAQTSHSTPRFAGSCTKNASSKPAAADSRS